MTLKKKLDRFLRAETRACKKLQRIAGDPPPWVQGYAYAMKVIRREFLKKTGK